MDSEEENGYLQNTREQHWWKVMGYGICDRVLRDVEVEFELKTGNEKMLGQFLASVCSSDFSCPPIARLADNLKPEGLLLVVECIFALKNDSITTVQKTRCLEALRLLGLPLDREGSCCDYKDEAPSKYDLENEIKSQCAIIEHLKDEITILEGELIRNGL